MSIEKITVQVNQSQTAGDKILCAGMRNAVTKRRCAQFERARHLNLNYTPRRPCPPKVHSFTTKTTTTESRKEILGTKLPSTLMKHTKST